MSRTKIISEFIKVDRQGQIENIQVKLPQGVTRIKQIAVTVKANAYDEDIITTKRYFGVGAPGFNTQAEVKTLTSENIQQRFGSFTLTAGAGQKVYFAIPKRLGTPTIVLDGFENTFAQPKFIAVTDDVTGFTEEYALYESKLEELGTETFYVK